MTDSTGQARRWSAADLDYLRQASASLTAAEIAAALGRTTAAVHLKASKIHVPMRRTAKDRPYFRRIDSPIKAYVLGLLSADGWVDDEGRIGLELMEPDRELVALVRDQLNPEGTVRIYPRKGPGLPRARFQVGSVRMAEDLAALGVGPRKTRTLAWPEALPNEYVNSYICGYFDGDGHVSLAPYPYWVVCSATDHFLIAMLEHIQAATGVQPFGPYRQGSIWSIGKSGEPVRALDTWLHRDVPGLARKRLAVVQSAGPGPGGGDPGQRGRRDQL